MSEMAQQQDYLQTPKSYSTIAIHHSQEPEKWDSMGLITPIVTSTTFKQHEPGKYKYQYGRCGNPTREVLENVLAKLDNGKYGLTFSSGLGAISTVTNILKTGDHIITGDDLYFGTHILLQDCGKRFGIESTLVNTMDVNNIEKALKPNTKLIWIETPTNPTLKVTDIKAVSEIAKKHNIILAVDNTFLTSYFQRPLDLGADLVIYSMTKYLNGHSDVIMGAIVMNDEALYKRLHFLQESLGIIPSPFDCYQVNRGLKTLALRMEQHSKNALAVAKYLQSHPKVEKVLHPGLSSHPQHELTKKQTSGHSGMVTFCLKGNVPQIKTFLKSVEVFTLAESLGGVESLIKIPGLMIPEEEKKALQIPDNLIRLSVGIEDTEDLIEDLEQALNKV